MCDDIGELEVSIPGYSCVRCDRNRHGGGVALFISDKLEYQVTMCRQNELEFLLVSVHSTNNVNEKVYIGLWYRPPANSAALDDLYSIFESLDISVFSSFIYSWEILILTFVITTIHFLASYLVFYRVLYLRRSYLSLPTLTALVALP